MNQLLILPIIIPLFTAATSLLLWQRTDLQRWLALAGTGVLLFVALVLLSRVNQVGILSLQLGNWVAPFGITLVADMLSAIMVALTGMMGLAVAVYSLVNMDPQREAFGYYPLFHILLMGVCGAFLTGDIFNLYVWFEVMLIASFVLIALGNEKPQLEGAIKYVTLNLLSSAIFLATVGILYATTGTLNMADLARRLPQTTSPGLATTLALLFLIAFGVKAGLFPLFFWLPASYHTPPAAVSAIFAGLVTKVGVYALIRVFTLIFVQDVAYTHSIILLMAGLTMVAGVLGATAQTEFRRILSFLLVSHIGYMIMGLGLFTPLALTASVFYITHHIIVKTNLFLISGVVNHLQGSYQLKQVGGLYRSYPALSLLFMISGLSLAGIPPLSGFWAKLALIRAGLETGSYLMVFVALAASVLTLFAVARIWAEAFWKPRPVEAEGNIENGGAALSRQNWTLLVGPIVVLAVLTVSIGLVAEPVFQLAAKAAHQLTNPAFYIQSVTGEQL